mmetsp:Transcript_34069/g.49394  ORF Transcript_34069/g.49394 Transcript_34069/m.49394 type:complete len:369 (-) Transcript_34069:134-1240(-)
MKIDGIGRYTASAIASIAYSVPVPVVDGNFCRVLSRLKGIANHIKQPILKDKLGWNLMQQLIDANGGTQTPGIVNQAIMELGATYCAPSGSGIDENDPLRDFYLSTKLGKEIADASKHPDSIREFVRTSQRKHSCKLCDPSGISDVFSEISMKIGEEIGENNSSSKRKTEMYLRARMTAHAAFPTNPPKKTKREDVRAVAVLEFVTNSAEKKWLMVRRPSSGLLAGQWEFPSHCVSSVQGKVKAVKKSVRSNAINELLKDVILGSELENVTSLESLKARTHVEEPVNHVFSHVRHTSWIEFQKVDYILDDSQFCQRWKSSTGKEVSLMSEKDMMDVGITAEVKKILCSVSVGAGKKGSSKMTKRKRKH